MFVDVEVEIGRRMCVRCDGCGELSVEWSYFCRTLMVVVVGLVEMVVVVGLVEVVVEVVILTFLLIECLMV